MQSLIEDFAAIKIRLAEIEQEKADERAKKPLPEAPVDKAGSDSFCYGIGGVVWQNAADFADIYGC